MHNSGKPVEICPECGHKMFRNSKPCAGALIIEEGKLLLVKRGIEPYKGFWDIPGGFLNEKEHPRDGAIREAREETGLTIEPMEILDIFIDKYKGQGYTHNTYYTANVVKGEVKAGDDAVEAKWFPIDELPREIAFPDHAFRVLKLLKERIVVRGR